MDVNFRKVKQLPEKLIPGTVYFVDNLGIIIVAETENTYKTYADKSELKTINGETIIGTGNIVISSGVTQEVEDLKLWDTTLFDVSIDPEDILAEIIAGDWNNTPSDTILRSSLDWNDDQFEYNLNGSSW